jgi:hypothetical protein
MAATTKRKTIMSSMAPLSSKTLYQAQLAARSTFKSLLMLAVNVAMFRAAPISPEIQGQRNAKEP